MERVGFIGLGAMGTPMAWNVHKGGFELSVYNRTASRAGVFRDQGVSITDSPADLARHTDIVIIMVTGPGDLLEVLEGEEGVLAGLGKGMTVINMSTVSREATGRAAQLVRETGARFVDAPVSGTVKPAENAELVILAGGRDEDIDAVEPLLLTMGKQVIRCGEVGRGTDMKLVINLMLGGMMALLAEGMAMSETLGLSAERVLEALDNGALAAPMYQVKGRAIRDGNHEKQFPVDLVFKDLNLALETAGRHGQPLHATATVRELYSAAHGAGLGDEDLSAVYKIVRGLGK